MNGNCYIRIEGIGIKTPIPQTLSVWGAPLG